MREQPAWGPALAALAPLLGQLAGIAAIVGWVALAHYWLGISTETALLGFIALAICGVAAAQNQRVPEPPPEKDFYVVTLERYRWNPTTNVIRPNAAKPELGGTIYAYDTLAAAKIKYHQMEAEQSSLDLEGRDLSYHELLGFDEEETRLWIVYARSKTEAHDKVFYDDSRSRLGRDGRTDDLLLRTNNERRRAQYMDWWSPLYRAALAAEREEIRAMMTYEAAIALFDVKWPLHPDSIGCEEAERLYDQLQSRSKQLEAAAKPSGNIKNTDWKAITTIGVARDQISKRISEARACGKYRSCTIHPPKPEDRASVVS
jgi:hypothetical protein